MVFDWATRGPYEGKTVTFIEEYRGYGIYFLTGPGNLYAHVDPAGVESLHMRDTLADARAFIDEILGPPVEPPPEPEPPTEGYYQYHSTYRGAVIYHWRPEGTPFRTYFGLVIIIEDYLAALHVRIDALIEPPVEPPVEPDPLAKTLIGPYRGIDIYKFTATGWFTFTHEGVDYTIQYWNPTIFKIDELLGALPEPDQYITTWAGYAIWKRSIDNMFYIMVEGVPQGEFSFLTQAQEYIENVLGGDPDAPVITPGDEPDYTPMDKDPTRAAAISGPINQFLSSVGLTPEALEAVRGSGADPEKAAQFAQSISLASIGAVAILGTIGVVAEVASLGQVEGVLGTIDMVLEKSGISGLLNEMFRLPFMAALVAPARHYWNSVYTPEIPGAGDLVTFLVREVITPDQFNLNMGLHGFSPEWSAAYWDVHWRLPAIGDVIRAEHLGIITRAERDAYFVLHDYNATPREYRTPYETTDPETGEIIPAGTLQDMSKADLAIYGGLTKTLLGRVDTRRAYQYGIKNREDLITMYRGLGYEEDSEIQADIQIRASVDGLQSAIRRETGMMYRDRLKDAREDESGAVGSILAERNTLLVELGLKEVAGEVSEEESLVLEAELRNKAETAIAEVRAAARAREEEAETLYRAALEEVGDLIDPIELWVLRYKLAAARAEVEAEFEIEAPTLVAETFEEPE